MKKNMKQSINNFIVGLLVALSIVYAAFTFSGLYAKQIENEARYQCAQSSRYTVSQSNDTQVWYPVEEMYQQCLTEKGIN